MGFTLCYINITKSKKNVIMKLFILTTDGLGSYSVIAETPNDAMKLLTDALNDADYGFTKDRHIREIEIVTEEVIIGFNNEPHFSNNHKLITSNWSAGKKEKN